MYRILVPVDSNDDRARRQLEAIQAAPYVTDEMVVDVLHVVEDIELPFLDSGETYLDVLKEDVDSLARFPESVAHVATELRDADFEARVHTVKGKPTEAIQEVAEAWDVDGIVIGNRRRTPVGKAVFGSVAQEIIRESDCPVTVAPV